ncbi:MAG TPA: efflux RND transporter periplasmic adaptor subunit [Vicinamibacteria bacterium]|nr:efflux RND transporter periplasmic adaptor subunit [Vicinamibacteria bacterium]
MKKRLLLVFLLLAVAGGAVTLRVLATREPAGLLRASGTAEAVEARVGFQAAGRVEEILVREGDRVAQGQVLARLDTAETEARRRQALAQIAAARALLDELTRGSRPEEVAQARSALAAAAERLLDAERDRERMRSLHQAGAVSRELLDKSALAGEVAAHQRAQALEQLRLLEQGPRAERIEAQRAQLDQAEAALSVIDANLANMTLRAPFPAVVSVRHREPGEAVSPGAPVLTLTNLDDRWVRIYVREDRIGAVQLGQAAALSSDTYRGKTYTGEVTFISPQAEFTPKSVQTTEERVKLVYAVKVRITGDDGHDLKPGMPADVALSLKRS